MLEHCSWSLRDPMFVPEGPNVYSHALKKLVRAPAEPDVAAARIQRAPLERGV